MQWVRKQEVPQSNPATIGDFQDAEEYISKNGVKLSPAFRQKMFEEVYEMKVLKSELSRLKEMSDNYAKLQPAMKKSKEKSFYGEVTLLSEMDKKDIAEAGEISTAAELQRYMKRLSMYREKVDLIMSSFPSPVESPKVLNEEFAAAITDSVPDLEMQELEMVHKMSIEKGHEWLVANKSRVTYLRDAIDMGVVNNLHDYQTLRYTYPPKKAIDEIFRMRREFEKAERKKEADSMPDWIKT